MNYTSPEVYEYISKQTNDPIVERKFCSLSGVKFPIFQSDTDFYTKISPTVAWETFLIPSPTLCPEERSRRRMSWRNERSLYKRKCDATWETKISIYSPDKEVLVYDRNYRWSDAFEAMEYGKEIDFTQSFMQQFYKLLYEVPHFSIYHMSQASQNCDYSNHTLDCRDCYMCFSTVESQDCLYCNNNDWCNNCVDCMNIQWCENSYDLIDCVNCYQCFSCTDCLDCKYCIWSTNLTWKEYVINNIQKTKLEFDQYKLEQNMTSFEQSNYHINATNCIWKHITNASGMKLCFDIHDMEKWAYMQRSFRSLSAYDWYWVAWWELNLELQSGRWYKIAFGAYCYENTDCYYTHSCFGNDHLFACVWLRNKKYCILNKQYTKQEYEKLLPKVIDTMRIEWNRWEFFDSSESPFWYNETIAHDYFPMRKSIAKERWYKWQNLSYEPKVHADALIKASHYQDISTIDDWILKKIFLCEESWRPFRLVKQELDFYRKHSLKLPLYHPDLRQQKRLRWRDTFSFTLS